MFSQEIFVAIFSFYRFKGTETHGSPDRIKYVHLRVFIKWNICGHFHIVKTLFEDFSKETESDVRSPALRRPRVLFDPHKQSHFKVEMYRCAVGSVLTEVTSGFKHIPFQKMIELHQNVAGGGMGYGSLLISIILLDDLIWSEWVLQVYM